MNKRGIVLLLVIFLSLAVNAAHDPSITIVPDHLYEGQEGWFNVSVNNWGSQDTITSLEVSLPGFTVTEIEDYSGWKHTGSIRWYDGTIENNVLNAMFRFKASVPLVNDNITSNWDVETEDNIGDTRTFIIPITLVNDVTGPILSNPTPQNGTYVKQSSPNQEVSIEAEDPETGINSPAYFYYDYCTGTYNYTIILPCSNGTCQNTMDTTSMSEGQYICYKFEVENNAGETSEFTGKFGLDGTPPTITLISPDDNAFVSENTDFEFKADDNLAASMQCNLSLDNNIIYSADVLNGEIQSTTINISSYAEGTYPWYVECTDLADWTTTSETRNIILDKTPPVITLTSPEENSTLAPGSLIEFTATDNYAVDSTWSSLPLNTSSWPEGENTIIIYANDSSGNEAQESFTFTIDSSPPQITLVSPAENATSDAHVNFTFSASDNYSPEINCSLYVDLNQVINRLVNNNSAEIIPYVLALGQHDWLVWCEDNVGNWDITPARYINIVDLSPPDIAIEPIDYIKRGTTAAISADVTDPSNVSYVMADVSGTAITLTKDSDQYYGYFATSTNTSLGTYTITYTANDTLGNTASASEDFEVIENYIFTLSLTPNPAQTGASVTLAGTVTKDDSSYIPEDLLKIHLPSQTANTTINSTGYFTYQFTAPSGSGNYDITVEVATANNITYSRTETLTVTSPPGTPGSPVSVPTYTVSGGSGDGSGGGAKCGDSLCGYRETCMNCPDDCGPCTAEETADYIEEPQEPEQQPEEGQETPVPEADERTPIGIGSAASWFGNIRTISSVAAMILLVIILTMAFAGNKKDKFSWDDYFRKRR